MSEKPNIVLLSHEFPFGNSETSFIEPELPYLNKVFNLSHVFTFPGGKRTSDLDEQTTVHVFNEENVQNQGSPKKFLFFIKVLVPWLLRKSNKLLFKSGIGESKIIISQFLKHYQMAIFLNHKLGKEKVDILYSYWFDHWNVAACIYKLLFNPKVKVVSRVHRYEIDENTHRLKFFPYHQFQMINSDKLCFISRKWCSHFQNKHKHWRSKFVVHRMGVSNRDLGQFEEDLQPFHLLSVSGNIPVKRMELQWDALNQLKVPVVWHHFGSDKEDKSVEEHIESSDLTYINHGFVPIHELHAWLKQNPIHFLLNTSSVEGVPVSMMECLSYGIPIIALDVGGISEIVTTQTGILCDSDTTAERLSKVIEDNLVNYPYGKEKRLEILKFQQKNFSSDRNYSDFCETLYQMPESK